MKKIFLILFLVLTVTQSQNINECKVDLYYATDIILPEDEIDSEKIWKRQSKELLKKYPQLEERIGERKVAYNISDGVISDYLVKIKENTYAIVGWTGFKIFVAKYLKKPGGVLTGGIERASLMLHDGTFQKQIESYNESIEAGHGVIVVAHSTGNLFTEEVFRQFDEKGEGWKQDYFHTIAVASTQSDIINDGNGVTFDNDIILLQDIGANDSESVIIENPNRHDWGYKNAVNEYILHEDFESSEYHKFEYYLGYTVMETTRRVEGYNTVVSKPRQTNIAKDMIAQWMYDEILAHDTRGSQWKTDQEFDKDTKDYQITVKHKYNSEGIRVDERVLPFNSSKKLYNVEGKYVKASCGGKGITSSWAGQKESEFWKIDNPEEEKIEGEVLIAPQQFLYQCRLIVQSPMQGSYYQGYSNRGVNTYNNRLYCQSFYPTKTTPLYKSVNFPIVSAPTAEEFNVLLDVEGKKLFTPLDAEVHEYLGSVFQNIQDTYGNNTYNILKYDKNPIECTMKWGGYTKLCRGRYTLSLERK
jgi:hypothetical protein